MRETRHLWIGNLPENTREESIAEHFKRYGKIDKVRLLPKRSSDAGLSACVAFMDIRSAQKAKGVSNVIGERELITDYYDPASRAGPSGMTLTPRANDEGQRRNQQTPVVSGRTNGPAHGNRRYDRESCATEDKHAYSEKFDRDRPVSYDKHYQQGSTEGRPENYDSDRSRGRLDTADREKSHSRSSNRSSHELSSKKHKPDSLSTKGLKKKAKNNGEDARTKGAVTKKAKVKRAKERGRSPTIKQKKSTPHGPAAQSPAGSTGLTGKKGSKISPSSSGRSSSSGSGSASTSRSGRTSSTSSSASTTSTNSSKSHTTNSPGSGSSYETEEGRKLVAMCIKKLPARPTVTSLRDGIFHEFKKYGKVKSVVVRGDGAERHALVLFRTAAEANKAVSHAKSKLLFGAAIEATIYEGEVSGQELEECGGIIDEFHPRASRTLFVGNLDKTVSYSDIQNIFVRFGEIVAIEIKKQHNIPQYAFLQYTDIGSVVRAITKMDGEKLGRNPLKLGFGKTVVSSCLWVDGVTDSFTENYLASCFQRYGPVKHVVIDRNRGQALVFYAQYDFAQTAMAKMRARKLNGSRLKMDYASHELIDIFLKHMQSSGQSIQGLENIRQLLQPPLSPTGSMSTQNTLPSSLPSGPSSSSQHFSRSSISQEIRPYYDDHPSVNYSDIASTTYTEAPGYRRGWRGRSRERYVYPEQPAHGRHGKRAYEETYERSDYHRERSPGWEHDAYPERRSTVLSHYDQDYRQKDYDIRRDQRAYARKPVSGAVPYDETYHYRGSRERPRDPDRGRDVERSRDRERIGDNFYSRSHMSPSHARYPPRKSRSPSPHSRLRDVERSSLERSAIDPPGFRRRGRSGTPSPEIQADVLRNRRNSVESKSSSRSGSRYASRVGDVDMRETISPLLESETLRGSRPHGEDERVIELRDKPTKSRVRSRVVVDSPSTRGGDLSPKPARRRGYKSSDAGSDRDATARTKKDDGDQEYKTGTWGAESPTYSEGRSRSGTPTRDENQDLIGEVIIKQPSVSSSVSKPQLKKTESARTHKEDKKHYDLESKGSRSRPRDKDYRKGFNMEQVHKERTLESGLRDREERPSGTKASRASSSSLLQRVHSPPDVERKSSLQYTKDFDYRKHHSVRQSKSSGEAAPKQFSTSKSSPYEQGEPNEKPRKHKIQSYARVAAEDDKKSNSSPSSLSPTSVMRSRSSGSAKLLKREYSPSPQEEVSHSQATAHYGRKTRKHSVERTKSDLVRQRSGKERDYPSSHGSRDRDDRYSISRVSHDVESKDVDERRSVPQKRRHSADARNDSEESPEMDIKRERKSSTGEGHFPRSKTSHHQTSVKHEAPMSIARQMFLQEEDESGTDSPMPRVVDEEIVDDGTDTQEIVQEECESQSPSQEETVPHMDNDPPSPTTDSTMVQKDSTWRESDDEPTTKDEKNVPFPNVTLNAARSLLPKRLPKSVTPDIRATQIQIDEQKAKIKKEVNEKGNLLDLEREKMRLQELLSKLDSEKQLDVKDAEEVAGAVLHELTNKAKSKILASRPPKPAPKKTTKTPAAQEPGPSTMKTPQTEDVSSREKEEVAEIPGTMDTDSCEVEETMVEEEIVVDTIEEVTEDEIIETEVEEETVDSEAGQKELLVSATIPEPVIPQIPEPVRKEPPPVVKKKEDIDHKQGYRKQMEARKREMDKMEKKLEHDRKKLFRKQEKEKKRQIKKVLAMRGPSQTVVSFVDEGDDDATSGAEDHEIQDSQEEAVQPHGKHPLSDQEEESESKKHKMDADDDAAETTSETVGADVNPKDEKPGKINTDHHDVLPSAGSVSEPMVLPTLSPANLTTNPDPDLGAESLPEQKVSPTLSICKAKSATEEKQAENGQKVNQDLEKPWPPDKKSTTETHCGAEKAKPLLHKDKEQMNVQKTILDDQSVEIQPAESDPASIVKEPVITKPDVSDIVPNTQTIVAQADLKISDKITKPLSRSVSPITPGSAGHSTPITVTTPQIPSKEPTPSPGGVSNLQNLTPTGSLTSSVSHKSTRTTPATTPSQISKTPTFTTPSPASSSSTSSSKSQARQKAAKTTAATHSTAHPSQQQRRSAHPGRQDHHSRSRGSSTSSEHKRRPSQHHQRGQSSTSHSHKAKEAMKAKQMQSFSRRPMASITVGLDSSPSKPLGRSELERLKMELESVKNQLSLEMSPSSLSPCSGDENAGKSPAQLLSPVSPILRSPADSVVPKKSDIITTSTMASNQTGAQSLTDRMKLLGRVKKRTPAQGAVVKSNEQVQNANMNRDKDLEFRQSRMFRSSIFDQDSERLLHIRQLEEERKQLDAQQIAIPFSSTGPLFSGSRFLDQIPAVGMPLQPGVAVVATPQMANSFPVASTTTQDSTAAAVNNSSSQHSSNTGPKNVYSLSSCNLPATAERIAHNDSGKNCNITQATVDSVTEVNAPSSLEEAPALAVLRDAINESVTVATVTPVTAVVSTAAANVKINHTKSGDDHSGSPPHPVMSDLPGTGEQATRENDEPTEFVLPVTDETQACDVVEQTLVMQDTLVPDLTDSKNSTTAEGTMIPLEEQTMEADISAMSASGDLMVSEEIVGDIIASENSGVTEDNENMNEAYYGADIEVVAHMDVYAGVSETVETSADDEAPVDVPVDVTLTTAEDVTHVSEEVIVTQEKETKNVSVPVSNIAKDTEIVNQTEAKSNKVVTPENPTTADELARTVNQETEVSLIEAGNPDGERSAKRETTPAKPATSMGKKSDSKAVDAASKPVQKTGKSDTQPEKKHLKTFEKTKKEKTDPSKDKGRKKKIGLLQKPEGSTTPKKHKTHAKDSDSKTTSSGKKLPENIKLTTEKKPSDLKKHDSSATHPHPRSDVKIRTEGQGPHATKESKGNSSGKKKLGKSHSEKKKLEQTSKSGVKPASEKKSASTENEPQKPSSDEQAVKLSSAKSSPIPSQQIPVKSTTTNETEGSAIKTEKESEATSIKEQQPSKPLEAPTSSKPHKRDGSNSKERKLSKHPKKDKKHKSDRSETKPPSKSDGKKRKDSPLPTGKMAEKIMRPHDESKHPASKNDGKSTADDIANMSEAESVEIRAQVNVEETQLCLSDDSIKDDIQKPKSQDVPEAKKDAKSDTSVVRKKKKKKKHVFDKDKEGSHKVKTVTECLPVEKSTETKSADTEKREKSEKIKKLKSSSGKSKKPPEIEKQSLGTGKHETTKKTEASEDKLSKKSSTLKKESKKHGTLKPSHSLPLDAKVKDKQLKHKPEKTSGHKKVDKSSSSAHQSRYAMIYDSSSNESDDSLGPTKKIAMKKSSAIIETSSPIVQKKDEDDIWQDGETVQKTTTTVWSDLDDGGADSHSRQRISSSLSSSSMSDSAGPPPVFTSSCLVTETIKSETILPPGYDEEEFSSSFYKMDDTKHKEPEPFVKIKTGGTSGKSKASKKKKKKLISTHSPSVSSAKKKGKHHEMSKHSGRRLIMSSSDDSDPEDDQPPFHIDISSSDSDVSDKELASNFRPKPSMRKPTNNPEPTASANRSSKSFFNSSESESDGETFSSRSNASTPRADVNTVKSERPPDLKTPAKSQESHKSKKMHGSSKSKPEKSESKSKTSSKMHDKKEKHKSKLGSVTKPTAHSSKETGSGISHDKNKNPTSSGEKTGRKPDEKTQEERPAVKPVPKDADKTEKSLPSTHAREKDSSKHEKQPQSKASKEGAHKSHKHSTKGPDVRSKPVTSQQKPVKDASEKQVEKPSAVFSDQKKNPTPKTDAAESMSQPAVEAEITKPKEKQKSGKHQDKGNPLSHSKKKKLKKKSKPEKADKKNTQEKRTEQSSGNPTERSVPKEPRPKLLDQTLIEPRAHSIFDSESDESDNAPGNDRPLPSDSFPKKQQTELPPTENITTQEDMPEKVDHVAGEDVKDDGKLSGRIPQKQFSATKTKFGHSHLGGVSQASPKGSEKRRGSAESFLTTSTTDDSDVEQRMAVQSALSALDKDADIVDEAADNLYIKDEPGNLEIVEDDCPPPFVTIGGQADEQSPKNVQHETNNPLNTKQTGKDKLSSKPESRETLSPSKRLADGTTKSGSLHTSGKSRKLATKKERGLERERKHKQGKKDGGRWKTSASYRGHEHGSYGEKKRLQDMERIKSLSHERDEEAVRSIVGIMDESSDADSYFSDVRSEADIGHTSSIAGKHTPEADTTKRRSFDSDSVSGGTTPFRSAEPVPKAEVAVKEEKPSDPEGGELSDTRTTAEEKELAAAVSSIEGLYADFGEKPPSDEFESSHPPVSFSKQKKQLEEDERDAESSQTDGNAAATQEAEVHTQEEIERGSNEAALAASALLESTEDEDPFFGYQPSLSQATMTKTGLSVGSRLTDSEANETDSGTHVYSSDDAKKASLPSENQDVTDIELPSMRTDLPPTEISDSALPVIPPVPTPSVAEASSGRKRQRQSRGGSSSKRSSSRESKSDWSVSDASMSESEPATQEAGKTAHRKGKGAKVCRLDAPQVTSALAPASDSYDFDSDVKTQTLSLPKPETTTETLPFVSTTSASSVPMQRPVTSSQEANTEKNPASSFETQATAASTAPMLTSPLTDQSLQKPSLPVRPGRRQSSDADGISPTGVPLKRRSSSSSSSAAHSPSRSQAQVRMQPPTQLMHHIGVPTYPHHQGPLRPQALPAQHRPAVHQEATQVRPEARMPGSTLPRPSFSHPHAHVSHVVHQTHAHHPQKLPPQPFGQQPQRHVLASPMHQAVVSSGPQVSPTSGFQGIPTAAQEQERHVAMQRTPSNPYLQQMTSGAMQLAQTQPRPTVPQSSTAIAVSSVRPVVQAKIEKPEPQRISVPQGGIPSTMPASHQAQISPQAGSHNPAHKNPDPGQPPMLQSVPQQQVFPHHALYYQAGLMPHLPGGFPQGIPGYPPAGLQYLPHRMMTHQGFLPGQAGLPHGQLLRPATKQQLEEMEKQAQQQKMHASQQKMDEKEHRPQQHTPGRKDAHTPTSTMPSPMAQNAPRPLVHPTRMPEAGLRPQMHPQMYAPSATSPSHLQRAHGDRVVRSQTNLSQEDMVAQHFRKSGFVVPATSAKPQASPASVPPTQSPGSAQDRQNQALGERAEPGQLHPAFHAAISPRPPAKQEQINIRPPFQLPQGMYPSPMFGQQLSQTFHGMTLPHEFALPPGGARFPGGADPSMWPRQNFRPPLVSMPMSQAYPRSAAPAHPGMPTMVQTRPPTPVSTLPQQMHPTAPSPTASKSNNNDQVMDLFQRYPVIWQGLLALKNDSAAVQTHFICGDLALARACLPKPDTQQAETDEERNLAVLRIIQRMRLEPMQLEGVDKRMMANSDFCLLLALPCGRDETDVIRQQNALKQGFIDYLKQKQAAGIVNVQGRQTQDQVQYVLHVFPPCDFTTKHLQRHAQDLLSNINDIQHIMIVIAAV